MSYIIRKLRTKVKYEKGSQKKNDNTFNCNNNDKITGVPTLIPTKIFYMYIKDKNFPEYEKKCFSLISPYSFSSK